MMRQTIHDCARALAVTGLMATVTAVTVQAQTSEGTVITNTATVTWTDANNNTYAPVNGSVSVTVGFQAGIDVISGGDVTPASPSSGNSISFAIHNIGNGDDSVVVDTSFTTAGVVSVTGWRLGATSYGDLTTLNAALSTTLIASGDSVTIDMVFSVNAGQGGNSVAYTLTANSRRAPTTTDSDVANISPPATYAVTVTPDGGQNLQLLPSNGTNQTFTFRVTNTGNSTEDFDLAATSPGSAVITIVSVNGVAGTTTQINLAPAAFADIDVEYLVGDVPNGSTDTLYLAATSVAAPATTDDGFMDLTVIRPVITITKAAYRDDRTTVIGPADRVAPTEFIQYLVTVSNSGSTDADSVHVHDALPTDVAYQSTSANLGAWTFTVLGSNVDADLTGTLGSGSSASFWIRVQIN